MNERNAGGGWNQDTSNERTRRGRSGPGCRLLFVFIACPECVNLHPTVCRELNAGLVVLCVFEHASKRTGSTPLPLGCPTPDSAARRYSIPIRAVRLTRRSSAQVLDKRKLGGGGLDT